SAHRRLSLDHSRVASGQRVRGHAGRVSSRAAGRLARYARRRLDWADHVSAPPPHPTMTPRPYTPIQRQKAVDAGRERILTAARELLEVEDAERFSLEAVARRARVSRMTVYNQFESKAKLLEALFDSLAERGPMGAMKTEVFAQDDP